MVPSPVSAAAGRLPDVRVGVVGAGGGGTALADLLARKGHQVALWAREPEVVSSVRQHLVNDLFLPNAPLEPSITASGILSDVVGGSDLLVFATPSHATRQVARLAAGALGSARPVVV